MDGSAALPVLTAALAQEIAGDTSEIIGFNVLITDRMGMVIGSGDRTRIGSFHEASVEVMQTLLPAAHSAAQARGLRGVRPGITLPIVLDDIALGTVGITGAPSQVRRFGLVVKRQTEILLRESLLLRSRLLRERALEDLIRDIAHFDADVVHPDLIAYRATELGYSLNLPRTTVLIDLAGPPTPEATGGADQSASRLALLQTIRTTFSDPHDVVAAMPADRFVILHRTPATNPAPGDPHEVRALCRKVVEDLAGRHGQTAEIGIGETAGTVVELHDAYRDADAALRLGTLLATRRDAGPHINFIGELRIHQLIGAAGHRPRSRLIDAVAGDLRAQPEWPLTRQTLIAWCEAGFNLVHAARILHIHRNTLVYRLNRIARVTGKPVHDHRTALALYLACLADQIHETAT